MNGTPEATQLAVSTLTALQYIGLLGFAGLMFFDRIVLRSHGPAPRRTRGMLLSFGIVAVSASVLFVPVSALSIIGGPLWWILDPWSWWPGVLWRPLVAAGLVLAGTAVGYAAVARGDDHMRPARTVPVLASLAALSAPVLVGHSQTVKPHLLAIAADLGHLVAGALWVGGVVGLLLFLAETSPARRGPARRGPAEGRDPLRATAVVRRFSRYALWSVLLLATSGAVIGVLIVGTVNALVTTGYGLTLLLKLGIILPIVGIAAYNRYRLLPAILVRPTSRVRWRTLHRTLAYEAALLIAVLTITGFLTNVSPSHHPLAH